MQAELFLSIMELARTKILYFVKRNNDMLMNIAHYFRKKNVSKNFEVQGVLALCEFHYCDFSKLFKNIWLMRF